MRKMMDNVKTGPEHANTHMLVFPVSNCKKFIPKKDVVNERGM